MTSLLTMIVLPLWLKLRTFNSIENKSIHIHIVNAPIGDCSDEVSAYEKASTILLDLYSLDTPLFRCSAHAAERNLKIWKVRDNV